MATMIYYPLRYGVMYGWEAIRGNYIKDDIYNYHWWNILPNGYIIDVTVDQFEEGEEVRVTNGDDIRYKPDRSYLDIRD